ncbi:UNKNOWN [Stylonychia lemnae]|uniref:Uncharacterized protein n=1 Tax=Stylonychia lemnae TaxID=5949 RepID=A0A078AHE7_STYLE|nr:UNKNOWN [Stylonychia lemnae]|eukprot:CDW80917.1 UNKNOWN [Stylonychia lemnae]
MEVEYLSPTYSQYGVTNDSEHKKFFDRRILFDSKQDQSQPMSSKNQEQIFKSIGRTVFQTKKIRSLQVSPHDSPSNEQRRINSRLRQKLINQTPPLESYIRKKLGCIQETFQSRVRDQKFSSSLRRRSILPTIEMPSQAFLEQTYNKSTISRQKARVTQTGVTLKMERSTSPRQLRLNNSIKLELDNNQSLNAKRQQQLQSQFHRPYILKKHCQIRRKTIQQEDDIQIFKYKIQDQRGAHKRFSIQITTASQPECNQ